MRKIETTLTLAAADDDLICASQTPSAGGPQFLTLAGGSLDVPRHISIHSAGNDSGRTFTVTGTDRYGNAISEEVTGGNAGAVATAANFATVTGVTVDDDTAGAVKVGTDGTAEGKWIPLNTKTPVFNVGIGCELVGASAALTYDLEATHVNVQADGFRETDGFSSSLFADKTAAYVHHQTAPVSAVRSKITAHTTGGVRANIIQAG